MGRMAGRYTSGDSCAPNVLLNVLVYVTNLRVMRLYTQLSVVIEGDLKTLYSYTLKHFNKSSQDTNTL